MYFSVVIPLYNKQRYIKKTVESALNQTFKDYEVIVVDDGSTDNSLKMVQSMESDRLQIIVQKNQGVAVARNTGIKHAKGKYISFLDADDKWNSNYLETIFKLTKLYPQSDIFVTGYQIVMEKGKIHHSTQLSQEVGCLNSYWKTLTSHYDFVWTSATTVRTKALMDAGMFRPGELIGQDLDMWSRVARNNPRVAYSGKMCVQYNRSAEQNARTRVKIAWPRAFLKNLEQELKNPERDMAEKRAIQYKYDLKMTAYIFTCIMAGEKTRARNEIKSWKGRRNKRNFMLQAGLAFASIMPLAVVRYIYKIRLKVF